MSVTPFLIPAQRPRRTALVNSACTAMPQSGLAVPHWLRRPGRTAMPKSGLPVLHRDRWSCRTAQVPAVRTRCSGSSALKQRSCHCAMNPHSAAWSLISRHRASHADRASRTVARCAVQPCTGGPNGHERRTTLPLIASKHRMRLVRALKGRRCSCYAGRL